MEYIVKLAWIRVFSRKANHMPLGQQGVLPGFCNTEKNTVLRGFYLKDPTCRFIECNSGMCAHKCAGSRHVDYKARSMEGLGAGDGAHLPSGDKPDFLSQSQSWKDEPKDPHDGDWDDRQLHLYP